MMPATPGLLFVMWLFGLGLFFRGFFLSRLELRGVSRPDDLSGTPLSMQCTGGSGQTHGGPPPAWGPSLLPSYRRLVILVVDAWRLDFATERMPQLAHLLATRPGHARLYRGLADAPTVTAQRLKGFTTGSLPTFIDLSSSFASVAIGEDNIVDQAAAAAAAEELAEVRADAVGDAEKLDYRLRPPLCALHFYGDDTWAGLFPTQFKVSVPLPSFDVADLDGVDRGVRARMAPALAAAARAWQRAAGSGGGGVPDARGNATEECDFRLLVAHVLGVDHVGHRHAPAHPRMAAKLAEMDDLLLEVVQAIDALDAAETAAVTATTREPSRPTGTLLLALGDHGMTADGNHGGGSAEETSAALLLYSPRAGLFSDVPPPLAPSPDSHLAPSASAPILPMAVNQIDVVPTVSLLLGWPIPHASLGAPLPGLRYDAPVPAGPLGGVRAALATAHAAAAASFQVHRYLAAYHAAAAAFPSTVLGNLDGLYHTARRIHASALAALEHSLRVSCLAGNSSEPPSEAPVQRHRLGSGSFRRNEPMDSNVRSVGDACSVTYRISSLLQQTAGADEAVLSSGICTSALDATHGELGAAANAFREFLDAAGAMCRSLWTQFDVSAMMWGLAALVATLAYGLRSVMVVYAALDSSATSPPQEGGHSRAAALRGAAAALCAGLVIQPREVLLTAASAAAAATRVFADAACSGVSEKHPSGMLAYSNEHVCTSLRQGPLLMLDTLCETLSAWPESGLAAGMKVLLDSAGHFASKSLVRSAESLLASLTIPVPALVVLGALSGLVRAVTRVNAPALKTAKAHAGWLRDIGSCFLQLDPWALLALLCIVLRVWALFSNSFITAEPRVVAFLLQTLAVSLGLGLLQSYRHCAAHSAVPVCVRPVHQSILAHGVVSLAVLMAVTRAFEDRRGLLASSASTDLTAGASRGSPLDSLPDAFHTFVPAVALPLLCVALFRGVVPSVIQAATDSLALVAPGSHTAWHTNHSLYWGLPIVASVAASQLSALLVLWYWTGSWSVPTPAEQSLRSSTLLASPSLRLLLPQAVYSLSAGHVGAIMCARLCRGVPHTAALHATHVFLALLGPLLLVLGPHSPLLVALLLVHCAAAVSATTAAMALSLSQRLVNAGSQSAPPLALFLSGPRVGAMVLWSLLVPHWFAATGHSHEFSSLQFACAFVGFDVYSPVISVVLLALNTFAAHVLVMCVCGPVLVEAVAAVDSAAAAAAAAATKPTSLDVNDTKTHCLSLPGKVLDGPRSAAVSDGGLPRMRASQKPLLSAPASAPLVLSAALNVMPAARTLSGQLSALLLLLLPGAVACATALFCCLERRHLMVWAVFAPKLLADAAALLVVSGVAAAGGLGVT